MDNFQYSVQLSDQDWAEFSATADECGLLQAGLASGDELLSSDIDQGDSSGSSPPRPPPLLTGQLAPRGRGWRRCEEEEDVATLQLVSRSQCESVLALGAGQQVAGTSAQFPGSGGAPPSQLSVLPGSAASTEEMQRLLQGPAPSPPGEPPQSSESPGLSPTSQKPPDSPGAPARSPGRKKRRTVGAKGGGRSGAPGPAAAQLGSLLPTEATREEGIRLAGPKGRGLVTGAAQLTAGPRPDSAGPPEHVARQGLGLDLSTSSPRIEQGTEQTRMTSRAELHMAPMSGQEAHPDVMASPDLALSTPACKPQPNMGLCTPDSEPQPDLGLSTPASKPQSDMASSISASKTELNVAFSTPASEPPPNQGLSIPASEPQPNVALSMPACKPQSDVALSTLASEPPPNMVLSTPAFKPQRDMALSTPASEPQCAQTGSTPASTPSLRVDLHAVEVNSSAPVSVAQPYTALPHTASKAASDAGVPAPGTSAAEPSQDPVPQAGSDTVGTEVVMPPGGPQEKPREQHSAVAPGSPEGEPPPGPMQAPKRKKVRFSMAEPSPKELGEAEAEGPPSPVMAQPSALKMATGGRGGSAAWDAVAIGPRPPQPRILKHLPPPALSASVGTGSSFAVTLPEAYEFFFCDTIEEEDEGDGEEATSQVLGEVQWPDTCEFFFRDCQAQRPRRQGCYSPAAAPHLRSQPAPAAAPGDFVPISIPEAYEHFLGEDRLEGVLPSAALLQTRASEAPQEGGSRTPSEPSLATVEQLSLAVRWAGDLCSPLTTSTFSQNDMCLVFVAFATWAVRTSDLHTPDAWKTVLLANIGTISAIRYFRRRVRRGRSPSRSCSRSPSPSS